MFGISCTGFNWCCSHLKFELCALHVGFCKVVLSVCFKSSV